MTTPIKLKDFFAYGIIAMPIAFAGIPLYIHAPDFYLTEYGISLSYLGLVLLVVRFIDAVQDPLIGYLSDKYSQYRPVIMLFACILLISSFTLLFKPLIESYLIWFTLCVILSTTAFSILTININTLGSLWSQDTNQKTTIASYREVFGLIGLILAVTLPSILQNNMPKAEAFLYVSAILIVIMLITNLVFLTWQKKHAQINLKKNHDCINLRQIKKISKTTKRFFAVYGISMLASSIPAVLVLYFIRDRLQLESYTGLFLLVYFVSGAIGITLWTYTSQRLGKLQTWIISMTLATVSFIWAYFLQAGDFWSYFLICCMSGIAFGGELVLPTSILADHVQYRKQTAAFHFGILAFLAKLSLSLAAAITLPYLDSVGFKVAQANSLVALQALSISYAAIPCLIKLISIYLLWRFINNENNSTTNKNTINRSTYYD